MVAVGVGDVQQSLGLFYVRSFFRTLYGSRWAAAGSDLSTLAVLLIAVIGNPFLLQQPANVSPGQIISHAFGFTIIGVLMLAAS